MLKHQHNSFQTISKDCKTGNNAVSEPLVQEERRKMRSGIKGFRCSERFEESYMFSANIKERIKVLFS